MSGLSLTNLKNRLKAGSVAMFFLAANLGAAAVPFLPAQIAEAAPVCVNDTAGANDEPGQKDLTRLCEESNPAAGTEQVVWNWDDKGTSGGGQSLDACGLFDSDNDGFINYSICVTTKLDPAVLDVVTIYTCTADSQVDRCAGPDDITRPYATTCTVNQQNTDPFAAGNFSPLDTVASCNFKLSDLPVAVSSLVLKDVCSYPSREPNSDPSDCVIIQDSPVALVELIKNINPTTDPGRFNLTIDGPDANDTNTVTNIGHLGTTGIVGLNPGQSTNGKTATVSEAAFTGTNLADYSKSISCVKRGTSTVVAATGTGPSWTIPIKNGDNIVCTITNTAGSSITIVKDAKPNDAQDFSFNATGTGVSNFSLDDDSNATLSDMKKFSNLSAGSYSFTEAATTGWDFKDIVCSQGASVQITGASVTVTLGAGQNVTCTFTNLKRGTVTVNKVTNPANDPTAFPITASGNGTIAGNATRNVTTTTPVVYDVAQGSYSVAEQVPGGWAQTTNTCTNLVINATNLSASCTITNTKLGSLTIIKDALPNDAQDFSFGVTGLTGGAFSLDDDADSTLVNTKVYSGLLPGQYSVTENSTPGWALISLACGNDAIVGATANVNLTAGQNVTCTFTNTKLGSIAGIKYTSDADSSLGPVLSGWTIYIDSNNNGLLDEGEASDVTDANGGYSFGDLLPDTYVLLEVLQAGWTQIFGASPVALSAGQNSTGNDFGNFQNGSINGFKWNDKNADGVVSEDEEKLNGWTITLYNDGSDADTDLDDVVGSPAVTAGQGAYSFTNLAPGTYSVCETQQTNWVQTYPANNACHTIVIDESGETNQANFGNQGRGSIQVVKNVDSDGDGDIDFQDVTDWTWDINSAGNFATGSGNPQNVAAGDYIISEDQKTDYHVTSSGCSGEDAPLQPTTSLGVTVGVGETVTCTFTNARDTAQIKVVKSLAPTNDEGRFNLLINDTAYATNVGDGGTTGWVTVPTGTYDVSETGAEGTDLDNYVSTNQCSWGRTSTSGEGTSVNDLVLSKDKEVTCTFYNERKAEVTVIKYNDINRNGLFDEGEETLPNWDFNLVSQTDCEPEYDDLYDFLSDDYDEELPCVQAYPDYAETQTTGEDGSTTFSNIVPNEDYVLTETQKEGWFLSNIDCDGGYNYEGYPVGDGYYITPNPGESITCVVGNYREANLLIDKQNDKTSAVRTDTTVTYTLVVSLPEDSGAVFDAVVRDILPAGFTYVPGSWTSTASETTDPLFDPIGEWQIGDLYPGDSVVLTYQATIDDSVSPGTYTNIAYSEACAIESRYHYDLGRVLDDYEGDYVEQEPYCKEVVTTDFVTSDVTVFEPKVLAASVTKTVLVNTGSGDAVRNALIGLSLVMMTIVLAMATRNQQKGTK